MHRATTTACTSNAKRGRCVPSNTSGLDGFNASTGVDDLDTATIAVTTHRHITGQGKGVNRLRLHFLLDRRETNHTLKSIAKMSGAGFASNNGSNGGNGELGHGEESTDGWQSSSNDHRPANTYTLSAADKLGASPTSTHCHTRTDDHWLLSKH
ncbi:hypothetical protein L1887_58689 [Cichorium endivia]|nr:hypothetical protein L1887_58689 [Cichorium endivia]